MREYYTFDDLMLLPKYSRVPTRSICSTATRISTTHMIEVPIIAAPMDTVCELEMAYTLWGLGALGIIHRFMSIQEQSDMIKTLWERISNASIVTSNEHKLLRTEQPVIAAAIGANGDYFERAEELLKSNVNLLCIDVAHGHHLNVILAIQKLTELKDKFKFDIMAGNIATAEAAECLMKVPNHRKDKYLSADSLRVGIGGGSVCESRIRTGAGVPQLSAVIEIRKKIGTSVPIISDGGIRYIGDVAKAIGAGANAVMVGSLFSGTDEAPGDIHVSGAWPNAKRYKVYRGSASESMKIALGVSRSHVEGTSKMVPLKGSVINIVSDIVDGLKSAMSYLGSDNITEMQKNAEFIKVTHAGMAEALPHLLAGG